MGLRANGSGHITNCVSFTNCIVENLIKMSDLDRTTERAFNGFSTPRRSPRKSRNPSSASDVSTSEIEVNVKKYKHWKKRRLETPDRSDSELSIPSSGSPSTLPSPVPKDKRGRFVSPETNPGMT